jgi:tryptophanyl-tRNA synthetase
VAEELRPVREKYVELMGDKAELVRLMKQGAEIATKISSRTLTKAHKKVGLYLTK